MECKEANSGRIVVLFLRKRLVLVINLKPMYSHSTIRTGVLTTLYVLLSLVSSVRAQSNYQYIIVPDPITSKGQYNLVMSDQVRSLVAHQGLVPVKSIEVGPEDLIANSCLALRCFIEYRTITNNLIVDLKMVDCEDRTVFIGSGTTRTGSPNDPAKQRLAINRAMENFDLGFIQRRSAVRGTVKPFYPKVEYIQMSEDSMKAYFSSRSTDPIEGIYKSYQSDGLGYYKFGILKDRFKYKAIIIESEFKNWKPGEVKGVFEQSARTGLYSVRWFMGNKDSFETFGILESRTILSVEFVHPISREKRQDKFIKMFPPMSDDGPPASKGQVKQTGSGFFLTSTGLLATNAHVVEGADKLTICVTGENEGKEYNAKVILTDKNNDIALLQIDDQSFDSLATVPYSLVDVAEVGEKVFTIGYPLNSVMGTNYKVADGIISAKSGFQDDVRFFQITVPLNPGNSGGPLFNSQGNVVGIATARLEETASGTAVQNVNYAIKVAYLMSLCNMLPNYVRTMPAKQTISTELSERVKAVKDFVCLIKGR